MAIATGLSIQLTQTPSGHLIIPGTNPASGMISKSPSTKEMIFAVGIKLTARTLTFGELKRMHLQLAHGSAHSLMTVLRSAQMNGEGESIQKLVGECKCQTAARRISPPTVECRRAKYNGAVATLDIIFPSAGCFAGRISNEYPALFTIGSLSRFINCSLLIPRPADHVGQTFANDWVRTIGYPEE